MKKLVTLLLLLLSAAAHAQVVNYYPPPGLNYNFNNQQFGPVTQIMLTAHLVNASGNVTLSGTQTIDGVATGNGTIVLVRNQTTTSQNGLWIASAAGTWSRPAFFPSGFTIAPNCTVDVYIEAGSTFANTVWSALPASAVIIDTSAIAFNEATVAASATRLGTVLTTAGLSTAPASQYLAGGKPITTGNPCVSFADNFGSIFNFGDVNGVSGDCTTQNPNTGHLNLENGGLPPSASAGTLDTNSTDHWGIVTGLSAATTLTITFAVAFGGNGPACTASSSVSLATPIFVFSMSTAAVTFHFPALTGTLYYQCWGLN